MIGTGLPELIIFVSLYAMGIPEAIIILIILSLIALSFWLPIHLRKKYPNKLIIGLSLAIVFIPFGQLYIKQAAIYYVVLLSFAQVAFFVFSIPMLAVLIISIISSCLIMYYRLNKEKQIKENT